jgi:acyl-CoA synthetase (NDP forming)
VTQEIKKPIVVLKSGRTPGGVKAAASHTKSLAGSDQVFSGICDQFGITRVNTTEELYDVARGFPAYAPPTGSRLMIITSSGGSGILAVDAAENFGLTIPALSTENKETFRKSEIPGHAVIGNPLDLTGSVLSADYLEALKISENNDLGDMYLLIFGDPIPGSAQMMTPVIKEMKKPVGVCYLGGGSQQVEETQHFQENHIPVYPTPERAVSFLARLYQRGQWLKNHEEKIDEQ